MYFETREQALEAIVQCGSCSKNRLFVPIRVPHNEHRPSSSSRWTLERPLPGSEDDQLVCKCPIPNTINNYDEDHVAMASGWNS